MSQTISVAKNVLVVEDDLLNQKLFEDVLVTLCDCSVTIASDGLEAMDILQQRGADAFSLIVLDIQLPGLSGEKVLKAIKSDPKFCHLPVIVVTAFAMRGDKQRFQTLGCNHYMSKPIDIPEFLQIVKQCVVDDERAQFA